MIPTLAEAQRSLDGLWHLAREGAPALRYFDRSRAGLLRSFGAGILAAPFYALSIALDPPPTTDWLRLVLVEGCGYVILWLAFPLALQPLAARLGRGAEWLDFVIAINWTGALVTTLGLLLTLLRISPAVPDGLQLLVGVICLAGPLAFEWFLARHLLRVGFAAAFGVVMLDLVLSLLVESAINGMLGTPPGS
jgi:hypothetical protein